MMGLAKLVLGALMYMLVFVWLLVSWVESDLPLDGAAQLGNGGISYVGTK